MIFAFVCVPLLSLSSFSFLWTAYFQLVKGGAVEETSAVGADEYLQHPP